MNYGYKELKGIPEEMAPWGMRVELPWLSEFGSYVLVGAEPADIELHHQVEVIDENGEPLRGVWVIFGFPGSGPDINLYPRENHWRGSPAVLRGNAQKTNYAGYAQHTFQQGGEDIWIWDLDRERALKLSSTIVRNCGSVRTPVGQFEHTGVKLCFQRRRAGVLPRQDQIADLERRVAAIEAMLGSQPGVAAAEVVRQEEAGYGGAIQLKIEIVDYDVTKEDRARYVAAVARLREVIRAEFPEITVIYPPEVGPSLPQDEFRGTTDEAADPVSGAPLIG